MLKKILFVIILVMIVPLLNADSCQDVSGQSKWCGGDGWIFRVTYCGSPCGYPFHGSAEYAIYTCMSNPVGEQTCTHWMNCSCSGPTSYMQPYKDMMKKWMKEHLRLTLWNDPEPITTKSGCQAKASI